MKCLNLRTGLRLIVIFPVLLMLVFLTAPERGMAGTADGLLKQASRAVVKGKYSQVIRLCTRAMRAEDLKPGQLAKAFYYRGLANRKTGDYAQAIADFGHAVWVKGLSGPQLANLHYNRGLAYQSLGLKSPAANEFAQAARLDPKNSKIRLAARQMAKHVTGKPDASGFETSVTANKAAQTANSQSSTFGNFFSGLFGTGKSAPPPATNKPVAVTDWAAATSIAPAKSSSWQANQSSHSRKAGQRQYLVQLASVRGAQEARKVWARLKVKHPKVLRARKPIMQKTDLGAKGVYYRVRIGPFSSLTEGRSVCNRLKSGGTKCILLRQ